MDYLSTLHETLSLFLVQVHERLITIHEDVKYLRIDDKVWRNTIWCIGGVVVRLHLIYWDEFHRNSVLLKV